MKTALHGEQTRYIIDLRTCAVEVQERGRMRGVGPSRVDNFEVMEAVLNH
jgi:hypothetical protein